MRIHTTPGMFFKATLTACALAALTPVLLAETPQVDAIQADPRDNESPWGIGTSAEWASAFPKFDPLMAQAGAQWLRLFPEWSSVQPKPGAYDWSYSDAIVADAKANHMHVTGFWGYFAPWASADGGTRKGPIRDMQYWRDYVSTSVERYKGDIKYWEVWNEFNGSFYQGKNKPKEYADMVVAAYDAAKKADPTAKIGMSVANFDAGFLDSAIKAGAAGHFDYLCVHPYENLGSLADGSEVGFLSLAGNLRDMLKANKQPADIPLWITEVGVKTPVMPNPEADAHQASLMAKGLLLSIAQGFQRIFWFEARGPAYGSGKDFGLIRADWTLRPSYTAYKTLTTLLGQSPKYAGWLDVGNGGYGFLFNGAQGVVLAAWAPPGKPLNATFAAPVKIVDLMGNESTLDTGKALALTTTPAFIVNPPAPLVQQGHVNLGKPYPWGGDYAHAKVVSCSLGAVNRNDGVKQINVQTTAVVNGLSDSCRRTDKGNRSLHGEGNYAYFRVDPQFVPYGTSHLVVTLVAKRMDVSKAAAMKLMYETAGKGYRESAKSNTIPADDQWHELTWELTDANFVGQWGYNFRFDLSGSPSDFYIKEVRVQK